MAKSSINFAKVSTHSFLHNDRSEKRTANSVHTEHSHKNEFDVEAKSAKATFDLAYKNAISKVTGRVRKADKKNCLWEAVVNVKTNTTMSDLKNLQKHIEKEFGFTGVQIALHKDEGHMHKNGNKLETNLHAHMSFFTLNADTGRQMMRREHVNKEKLRELQTKTAEILNMDRGIDKRISGVERLEHKAYKQHIQKVDQVKDQVKTKQKAKQKDLKAEVSVLREEIKQSKGQREDYAALENLNRKLKEQIKAKDLSIEDMQHQMATLKDTIFQEKKEKEHFKSVVELKEIENIDTKKVINALQEQKNTLEVKVHDFEEKSVSREDIEDYEHITQEFEYQNYQLGEMLDDANLTPEVEKKGLLNTIFDYVKGLKDRIMGLEDENKKLKTQNEELKYELQSKETTILGLENANKIQEWEIEKLNLKSTKSQTQSLNR